MAVVRSSFGQPNVFSHILPLQHCKLCCFVHHPARLLEALQRDIWGWDSIKSCFWPSNTHAWLCKSIQWLLLPLILHEHVTLFWRPLCFHSMPLHLFIFLLFSFSFIFNVTYRPVNMAGQKVSGCLMAEIALWWHHLCFELFEMIFHWFSPKFLNIHCFILFFIPFSLMHINTNKFK